MTRMSALLPTPRAAKKLANLYRLVRIGVPRAELTHFTGSEEYGGTYQVVQIILAMLVCSPRAAHEIFQMIMNASPDESVTAILNQIRAERSKPDECALLAAGAATIVEQNAALADVAEYQQWCPILARYSFHTRKLHAADPPRPIKAAPPPRAHRLDTHHLSAPPAAPKPLIIPIYLVCDVSDSAGTDVGAVNRALGNLRKAIAADPLLDDVVRICVISFADSAEVILPIGRAGRPAPPLTRGGRGANYSAAFGLAAKTIRNNIAHLGRADYRIYRPYAFFFTAGAPTDRLWNSAFKRILTSGPQGDGGMGEYPVFIPVGLPGAREEVLRRLAYPPASGKWYASGRNGIEDIPDEILKTITNAILSEDSDIFEPNNILRVNARVSRMDSDPDDDWI